LHFKTNFYKNELYKNNLKRGFNMPYKVGKKTKTKGWQILKHEGGKWKVIAHSDSREKAEASIRAREAHLGRK
jgi:hypothetical protein